MTTQRRRRQWIDNFVDEAGTTGQTDELNLSGDGDPVKAEKGSTLVRMIVDLVCIPSVFVGNSVDTMEINLGVGIVSDDLALGSLNVGIQDEIPISGWMWRRRSQIFEGPSAPMWRVEMDIRSQRKLMYGEPRLFISYATGQGTPFSVDVSGIVRCLYLLP